MAEHRIPKEEDYPSNSRKQPIEKVEAVEPAKLKGQVKTKHSVFQSVKDEFINEDAPSVGSYILYDILLPALKDLTLDILHGGVDAAFGGGRSTYRSRSYGSRSRGGGSYISYNRMYDDRSRSRYERDEERYESRRRQRDLDDIIFDYRDDADDVRDRLVDYLERYGEVPVSYLYDVCGMTVPGDFTSDDWGWTSLRECKIRKVRDGWILDLPRVRPL